MLVENFEEALPWFERYRSLRKAAADVRAYRDRAKAVRVRLEVTGDGLHSVTTFENADENRVALDLIEAALAVAALKLAGFGVFTAGVRAGVVTKMAQALENNTATLGYCIRRTPNNEWRNRYSYLSIVKHPDGSSSPIWSHKKWTTFDSVGAAEQELIRWNIKNAEIAAIDTMRSVFEDEEAEG